MKQEFFLNGRKRAKSQAKISAFNRTLLFGEGLFETFLIHDGDLVFLEEHLNRLFTSMRALAFPLIPKRSLIKQQMLSCCERSQIPNGLLKWLFLPKADPKDLFFGKPIGYDTLVLIRSLKKTKNTPFALQSFDLPYRSNLCFHKTMNYTESAFAIRKAHAQGFDDILFLYQGKYFLESTTANVFFIRKNTLYTPSFDLPLLNGVTRAKIIEIAEHLGIKVIQKKISKPFALSCDGMFLSRTSGLVPIKSLDKTLFSVPSKLYSLVERAYCALTSSLSS